MSIWRWPRMSDQVPSGFQISLGEGNTALVPSRKIGPSIGLSNLYFKLESTNPTGSFKDRFAASAISHMLVKQQSRCIATSSGNTGSALAAYCAVASIACHIAIVETAPLPKLRQMMVYGANIFRIEQFGLDASITAQTFTELEKYGNEPNSALQISSFTHSPSGMTGVESISYELHEQVQRPVEHVFCPAGGGGLCVAVCRGFKSLGNPSASTAVHCVQPEGNDTMAGPLRDGTDNARDVACTTRISGLQVASVVDGNLAIQECRSTGGTGHVVSDEQIWEAQKELACQEGIFCEPAGATALAGAIQATSNGQIRPTATVVCLITGSGFKDEGSVDKMLQHRECPMLKVKDLGDAIES